MTYRDFFIISPERGHRGNSSDFHSYRFTNYFNYCEAKNRTQTNYTHKKRATEFR